MDGDKLFEELKKMREFALGQVLRDFILSLSEEELSLRDSVLKNPIACWLAGWSLLPEELLSDRVLRLGSNSGIEALQARVVHILAHTGKLPQRFINSDTLRIASYFGESLAHQLVREKRLPKRFETEEIFSLENSKGWTVFHESALNGVFPPRFWKRRILGASDGEILVADCLAKNSEKRLCKTMLEVLDYRMGEKLSPNPGRILSPLFSLAPKAGKDFKESLPRESCLFLSALLKESARSSLSVKKQVLACLDARIGRRLLSGQTRESQELNALVARYATRLSINAYARSCSGECEPVL